MKQSISLTHILAELNLRGYTEHFYIQNGKLYYNGARITNVKSWIHCTWHDPVTDETIYIYCCEYENLKGLYLD